MYRIGDIVQLKTGSHDMYVVDLIDRDVVVAWYDYRGKACEAVASWLAFKLVEKARL